MARDNFDGEDTDCELDTRKLVLQQNRKNKKSGGFQSMGLTKLVFNGILKKGYKVPTPIQRKCIPIILEGKDVVAMARTGSGKTAAFLIPMFEKLKARLAGSGARALIISPTRELALQTLKFTRELGKFLGLRSVAILGGDRIDEQFAAIHENPDVIVATPGRFLHVVIEMDLKLSSIEYIVFDEADRLFEMGFQQQLLEIFKRLPDVRQTLLFSATLPRLLVDFAKAGLNDPILIRLDVETKLSDNLKLAFFSCRNEDKLAILLHLFKDVISHKDMTLIFLPTKHHIEYTAMLFEKAGIDCTYIYSSLDQEARKTNVIRFQRKKVSVMLVTDLAARGIDIPLLDNVINVNFPSKSKLFVHRVGRVARAGRSGTAYSLIAPDEVPYVLDLHLFLGIPVKYAKQETNSTDWHGVLGSTPQTIIDDCEEELNTFHNGSTELTNMKRVCKNAYGQYLKSRPAASTESIRRAKDNIKLFNVGRHPLFAASSASQIDMERQKLLNSMKSYKPHSTIFEVGAAPIVGLMNKVREKNSDAMNKYYTKLEEKRQDSCKEVIKAHSQVDDDEKSLANEQYIENAFSTVVTSKKRTSGDPYRGKKKLKKIDFKDEEHYIPYRMNDYHGEKGLELEKSTFDRQAQSEVLDFTADDEVDMHKKRTQKKWDRKKKKFVQEGGNDKKVKRIKTESGVWIPASYKSDLYKEWQKKSKVENENEDSSDQDDEKSNDKMKIQGQNRVAPRRKYRHNKRMEPKNSSNVRRELKTKEEILKAREISAKNRFVQRGGLRNRSRGMSGAGRGGSGRGRGTGGKGGRGGSRGTGGTRDRGKGGRGGQSRGGGARGRGRKR